LLVDATAVWCGPCQMMDRTTWLDAGVVAWIDSHAVAFQLDVDAHSASARELSVRAMPTVIAFRNGDEIDRVVGFQKPEAMLEWLCGLARGVTSLDRQRAAIAVKPDDVRLRLEYARMLVDASRVDEAVSEYVWSWKHGRELRPFFAGDLQRIASRHASARAAIAQLRDELAPDAAPSLDDLRDWLLLNDILGDGHRSLRWFDDHYDSQAATPEGADLVEQVIGPLLIGAHRWRDARAIYGMQLWRIPVRELVRTWRAARRQLR